MYVDPVVSKASESQELLQKHSRLDLVQTPAIHSILGLYP